MLSIFHRRHLSAFEDDHGGREPRLMAETEMQPAHPALTHPLGR